MFTPFLGSAKNSALFIFSLITLFIFSHQSYSQWVVQNSGVNSQLNSVYFVNQNTGFVCGFNGKILRTTNGGTNWISITYPDTIVKYTSVFFVNSSTGYISGEYFYTDSVSTTGVEPSIIKTTNAGISWFSSLHDTAYTLKSIRFVNPDTGFATGGLFAFGGYDKIISTTNGGSTWKKDSLNNGYLNDVEFIDAQTGFTNTLSGSIYKTTNSGTNWNQVSTIFEFTQSMCFLNSNIGFAACGNSCLFDSLCSIYRTTNNGVNWSPVYTDHRGIPNRIFFSNINTGYAVGSVDPYTIVPVLNSRILKTTNSGLNWFNDTLFSNIYLLNSIYFTDVNTGYSVGGNGVILKTTTGGNVIGIKPISTIIPKEFSLKQNYPNPFNPSTKIEFDIPKSALAKITVYDLVGREVGVIVNQEVSAGTYSVQWDASKIASGVYFYRLTSGDFVQTKKMMLIK